MASERPDVVRKMGYDPESFYAGGLAMLAEGGSIDFAALSEALGNMGGNEKLQLSMLSWETLYLQLNQA